jgi:hypothetical protein
MRKKRSFCVGSQETVRKKGRFRPGHQEKDLVRSSTSRNTEEKKVVLVQNIKKKIFSGPAHQETDRKQSGKKGRFRPGHEEKDLFRSNTSRNSAERIFFSKKHNRKKVVLVRDIKKQTGNKVVLGLEHQETVRKKDLFLVVLD